MAYYGEEKNQKTTKPIKLLLVLIGILLFSAVSIYNIFGVNLFSISNLSSSKINFEDPISGNDLINDLKDLNCTIYEGTIQNCDSISSYSGFLSSVRGRDIYVKQTFHVGPENIPNPSVVLPFNGGEIDIGTIFGSFNFRIEDSQFVSLGTRRTRKNKEKPSTLWGVYVFLDGTIKTPIWQCVGFEAKPRVKNLQAVVKREFRYSFNTKVFSDGLHIYKIIATNGNGINKTQTIKFFVVSEALSNSYKLSGDAYGIGVRWEHQVVVIESIQIFDINKKTQWSKQWDQSIANTQSVDLQILHDSKKIDFDDT